MAKAKKKSLFNNASVAKSIVNARDIIANAIAGAKKAAKALSVDRQKLTAATKNLKKKQGILVKRKKNAAVKLKKKPSVNTRKSLKKVDKEIEGIAKDITNTNKGKEANSLELTSLNDSVKRLSAYLTAMISVDKAMPKPKVNAPKIKAVAKKTTTKTATAPAAKKPTKAAKKRTTKKTLAITPSRASTDITETVKKAAKSESVAESKVLASQEEDMRLDEAKPEEVAEAETVAEFDNEETTEVSNRDTDTITQ